MPFIRIIRSIDEILAKLVSVLVITVLLSMLLMAFLQVILRNFFGSGIPWMDVVTRNLVLWLAMLGGTLATRGGRQISIDIFSRISGKYLKLILAWITGIFTVFISYQLARASFVFICAEKEFGTTLYNEVPIWYAQLILPIGFSLIGLQVIFNLVLNKTANESSIEPSGNLPEENTESENKSGENQK